MFSEFEYKIEVVWYIAKNNYT